ncbi:MAG TPA: LamG domain-containing protein, partial [Kofleriaceae bacterium]
PSLQPATGFTLEGWFASDDGAGAYQTLLGRTLGNGNLDSYSIWYTDGYLHAGPSNVTYVTVPWTAVPHQWHHVAVTTEATGQRLYLDGMLAGCALGATPTYDAHPLMLGADIENGMIDGSWHGMLDELRVFSSARTGDQVWADMHTHELGATTGLIGEWTFDEGTGQTTADSSGAGNPGQLGATTGAEASDPVWVSSTVPH